MRRPLAVLLACVLSSAIFACSKDEVPATKPSGTSATAASAVAPPPPAPLASAAPPKAATAAPLAERLKCEKLLPDSALLTFAAEYKVTQQPAAQMACPECGPGCNLLKAGKAFEGAHVAYECNAPFAKAKADATLEALKKELKKSAAVKGFGRAGVHGEKDGGMFYTVVAFDDDTDCKVTVDWMRGKKDDALALARTALAGVKPADLK